ncbi:pilus assembly protein [Alicyclobacillus sp.]|uniref:TadE/TadG family type IV pilus assembly protein n=1 Tax=Alicyclobacillus sp. TaxID=61169 RepID=UPI0025BF9C87|nr:pilus assembly protein [Alicyclobacillus sp.]MCL6517836.1 pilus assembly protein [Alicyclobacillus sp.]
MARGRDGESAQAMLEFALIVPLFALFLLGIVDFGRILAAQLALNHAARDAVRAASVGADDEAVGQVVQRDATLAGDVQWAVAPPPPRHAGDEVEVSVSGSVSLFDPLFGAILGPAFRLQADAVMRVE